MKATTTSAPRARRFRRHFVMGGIAAAVVALGAPTAALAATTPTATSSSTVSMTTTAGSLTIGTPTAATITGVTPGGSATGLLPRAKWTDSGLGTGWHGQIQVSDLSYTGAWKQLGGTTAPLGVTSSGAYSGTTDGIEYIVTVKSGGTTTSTSFTWTSNTPSTATNKSGTGGGANNTALAVGPKGVTITFKASTQYAATKKYEIKVGTQLPGAMALDKAASGATIVPGTGVTSPSPTFYDSALTGGGVGTYGSTAVTFLKATAGDGMGNYEVTPGVSVQTDPQTWGSATYKADVQYSITKGP